MALLEVVILRWLKETTQRYRRLKTDVCPFLARGSITRISLVRSARLCKRRYRGTVTEEMRYGQLNEH